MSELPDIRIDHAGAIDPLLVEYDYFNHLGTIAYRKSSKKLPRPISWERDVASATFAAGPGIFMIEIGNTLQ